MRHLWADPVRPDHHVTYRGCMRCGMLKVSRHEGALHWCEYYRMPDEARVLSVGVPPCSGAHESYDDLRGYISVMRERVDAD